MVEELRPRLLANGFREELLGDMHPPAAHYHVTTGNTAFYAEFLTPLIGGYVKRGRKDLTTRIGGVSVQKLRYLELLLEDPWDIVIAEANGFPTAQPKRVRVPNAAAFLVQKILILNTRSPEERANAARIATSRALSPERIRELCAYAWGKVFVWERISPSQRFHAWR